MDKPNLKLEQEAKNNFSEFVIGIDEVGRGALCGPVIAVAIHTPEDFDYTGIKDSKKIPARKRMELFSKIIHGCPYSIGEVNEQVIDKINIKQATMLAMTEAIENLPEADFALIDGNFLPPLKIPAKAIIKGDSISVSIAAASIVAKVYRDMIMEILHEQYPVYCWDKNKGYGTRNHLDAIIKYGPCKYHRKTFNKVKQFC